MLQKFKPESGRPDSNESSACTMFCTVGFYLLHAINLLVTINILMTYSCSYHTTQVSDVLQAVVMEMRLAYQNWVLSI